MTRQLARQPKRRYLPLSPCHLASMSPRGSAALTFALLHRPQADLHLCTVICIQPPRSGCQLTMAERPIPELPIPVPVTRHHGLWWLTFALLHRP